MGTSTFSLEFDLNIAEIRNLNKMYFKDLYKKRIMFFLAIILLVIVFLDWDNNDDFFQWIIRNLFSVIFFLFFHYLIVNAICKVTFRLVKKLLKFEGFVRRYKFSFTNSVIGVHSPLGGFTHRWCQIEKAILTKDLFLLYIRDRNGYIISISTKDNCDHKIAELIAFIDCNVTHVERI
ncbi:hypothetical protein [Flavobacterium collinsii]|uniref:YcxB-like protein domain-containing protein n=1 Tax=Flavobacterium collinsii TaxID=1114861 RepID=A0A9W4TI74_9FLAO|nr:hypothetical protein [Flavobacterium collinsii]CAI2768483.1 conserved protein of unknown function [Flavobacterium collinsii]